MLKNRLPFPPLSRFYLTHAFLALKNLPNIITIARVPCLFVIALFASLQIPCGATIAFAIFLLAAISDYFDGWLARRLGVVSNFGKFMDALTDKILMLGVMIFLPVLLPVPDTLPTYYVFAVMIILVREFLITGLRLIAASSGIVLAAERSGKIKTVLQIAALILLLLVHAGRQDWGWEPATVSLWLNAGMVAFLLATLLTISSGTGYLVKYWHILWDEPKQQ